MKDVEFEIARPSRLSGCAALLSGISHRALAAALIGLMAGFPVRAQQLPTGGTVTAGSATIVSPNANTLNVNQSTNQAIINWQSFSVGQNATVNFNQPGASSSTLNRVIGTSASMIDGMIRAPGTVILVNPNGIAISKTGVVNVGSFAASTLNIKDSDYLSGNYKFTGNGGSAGVTNAGRINVSDGGFAALLGGQVSNSGTITARLGKVGLGAGELITLDFAGDGFLSVAVPSSQLGNLVDPNGALVTNSGKIRANGGTVMLSAATAANVLRDAVNVPGSIRANSVGTHNGKIVIGGGAGGRVSVSGKLAANSKTGKGGDIAVTGKDIKLAGAQIDASGKTGGGNINIGGGRQGQGPLQRAETVTVDAATTIKADAKDIGNGGSVVIWSDALTTFAGKISAKGGAISGNGGEAEVSGKAKLSYTGFTDLSATNGAFGTLLLDPYNITISTGGDSGHDASFTANADDSVINVTTLQNALAGANVTISTGTNGSQSGNITVANAVTWSAATTLSLSAAGNIVINAPITGANGTLVLSTFGAGAAISQSAAGAITANFLLLLASSSGSATLNAASNSVNFLNASLGTGSLNFKNATAGGLTLFDIGATGGITMQNTGAIGVSGAVNAGSGTVALTTTNSGAAITQDSSGAITAGTLALTTNGGNATLTAGTNTLANLGTVSLGSGALALTTSTAGTFTVNGSTTTADGGIAVTNTGGNLSTSNVVTSIGPVALSSTTGNVVTGGSVISSGSTALTATNGSITLGGSVTGTGVSLTSASSLSVNQNIFGNSGDVVLTATGAGSNITQTAGRIQGAGLLATALNGSVTLTAGATNNSVATIAGRSSGNFAYTAAQSTALTIGTVAGTSGIVSSNGNVAVRLTNPATAMTVGQAVTASNGDVTLQSGGNMGINAAVTANTGTGTVSLTSTTAQVSGTGVLTAAKLGVSAGTNINLQGTNVIRTFAASAGGYVVLFNDGSFTLDTVGSINNVTAGSDVVLATITNTAGDITQASNGNGRILAGGGLVLQAQNGSIVLDQANSVSGSFAVIGTANGDVTLRNTGTLNVGTAGAAPGITVSGIAISGAKTLSLQSDTGSITQGSGSSERIVAGTVSGQTLTGGNMTLTNASNSISALGATNLGAGSLSLLNSVGNLTVTGAVSAGSVALTTTGSNAAILESGAGAITANSLSATATGVVAMLNNNNVGSLTGTSNGGFHFLNDSAALTVNSLSGGGQIEILGNTANITIADTVNSGGNDILLATGGALTINAAVTAGTNVAIQGNAGITQGAGGIIAATNLIGLSTTGNIALTGNNAVSGNVGFNAANGSVSFKSTSGFNVGTIGSVTFAVGPFSITPGIRMSAAGSTTLTAGGAITQGSTANDIVSTGTLNLTTTGNAGVTLGNANNAITNLGAVSIGTGALALNDTGGLTVTGTVNAGSVQVSTTGTITIDNIITAAGGGVPFIWLTATGVGKNITQTATGGLVATFLELDATGGSVDATAGAANNNVARLAGRSSGDFAYTDGNTTALLIGTVVGATPGIVSTNGSISVSATKSGAQMQVSRDVTASNGNVTLLADSDLFIGANAVGAGNGAVTANGATGVITLTSNTSQVRELTGGSLTGAQLAASAGTNVDLRTSNTIGTFAANAPNGYVVLFNNGSIALDLVGVVNGVIAFGDVVLATIAVGNITQTANGKIIAGGGLVVQANGGSIVLDQANSVSGNFAVAGSSSTDVTLRNIGNLNIGSVTPSAIGVTFSGVAISGTLSLNSNSGGVTQSSAIIATTIQGATGGGNMTLTNASNNFVQVGATNLGAGALSLFDSAGTLTVSGAVSAGGGISLQTPGALAINAALNAGSGNVSLTNTTAGITQTAGITGNTLTVASAGNVDLTSTANSVAAIEGGSSAGRFYLINDRVAGLTVTSNGIANTGGQVLVWERSGSLTVNGTVNSNGANVGLWSSSGVLTINASVTAANAAVALWGQSGITQATTGVVTSASLLALGNGGGANLALTADNAVGGNIGIQADNGSVSFTSISGFNVGGISSVNFTGVGLFSFTSGIHTAAAGLTTLTAGGNVTQSLTDVISTGTLNLATSGNANVTLGNVSNAITNLGTVSTGTGRLVLRDTGGLTVTGAVNAGIVDVATTGTITIDNIITATNAGLGLNPYIWLTATGAGSNITQTANGGLVTPNLELDAGGSVNATAGAANNNVSALSGRSSGDFAYADGNSSGLTISNVANPGIVSTNGSISVSATNAQLTVVAAVTASSGNVTLQAGGNLFIGDGSTPGSSVTASNTTGVIALISANGAVTETATGSLSGAQLSATAATNVDLRQTLSNTIGTFGAKATTGYVVLFNSTGITLDRVGSTDGVTAGTDVVLAANTGNITQTALGTVTAGGGLMLQATGGSIAMDQANAVSGNFVVLNTSGDVTLRNTGDLNIGSLTPAAFGGGFTFGGVTMGATKVLTLRSDNGAIAQGGNAGDRIVAGTVQGQTTDKDMTLTHAGNQFASVGTATLGTGALSLLNSVGGLTVTGAVTAGGGISLQTPGALAINNTLNGGTGTVTLTTTDVGAAITQNATGVITAGTLALTANNASATLDTATNAVTNLGAASLGTGALSLRDSGDLTVTGAVTANGGVALETGANGTLTINASVDTGAGDVFLTADNMTIAGAVRNTGSVNIATVTAGRVITLGDAPTPAGLVIDNASGELNQFIGMSAFNVGKTRSGTTNAGAIQLGQATIPTDAINLFTTAGVTQVNPIVFIGATGAGTLSIAAVDTVSLAPGVAAGLITGSVSGANKHFIAYGGGSNINIGPITTNGGEIAVGNNNGTLAVVGDLTSNGGHINGYSAGVFMLGANLDARRSGGADGSIGLRSNAGINQTSGGLKGKDLLAFLCNACIGSSTGNITLDSTTNAITGNVTLVNLTGGNVNFTNSSAYTVGGISSISYAADITALIGPFDVAPFTGGLGGPGIRTAGTNATVTLTAGGNIAQATAADDIIETNTFNVGRMTGVNPNVTLDGFDSVNHVSINKIANLGTVSIGQGAFALYNATALIITGAATAGGYNVASDSNLTQAVGANIDTSSANGALYLAAGCSCGGGTLTLNANLNAGTGAVYLAGDTVTQSAGAITAQTLNVQAITGASLNSSTNDFANINALSNGDFSATTSRSLRIGNVGVGSNSGAVSLTALGTSSDIVVPTGTSVFAGTDLTLNAGRDIDVTGAVQGFGTASLNAGRDIVINGCGCGGVAGNDVLLSAVRDIQVDSGIGATQTVTLLAGRDITDTADGRILAVGLRAVAATGGVNLSNSTGHGVGTIAGSASGAFSYKQDGNLTIGSVGASNGLASTNGGVTVDAGSGGITVDTLARVIANSAIVLAGATFKNNRGSDAVVSTAGRWLIYASAPGTASDYNGLNSNNTAIWATTYPTPVTASGNRYVFAFAPTVTVSPDNVSKVYGQVPVLTYSALSGLQSEVAGAYLADTLATATTGAPVLTSAGSAANATVAGGPYLITIALGSLAGLNGYSVNVGGTGNLTVTPATLTYVADSATRTAGTPNPAFTGTVTGFVNGETLTTATTGAPAWNSPADTSSPPGSYGIYGSGLSAANYIFVQAAGNATALKVMAAPSNPTSQATPPVNNPQNPGVNITYQSNPTGVANISFTTGAAGAPSTPGVRADDEQQTNGVVTTSNPITAGRTNNGFVYQPISVFDGNQYSQLQVPDYADKASQAAVLTMIARAAQSGSAADFMIDSFWTGSDATWAKGSDGKPAAGRVTFSDGADKTVSPAASNGFPVEAGKTDVLAMLGKGPVMLGGSGTPAVWLLAIKVSDDGKGIVANDPISGRQVLLSYDAGTKTVGGVAGILDGKTQKFVALSEAAATQQAGEPTLKADSLAPLQNFTPATFFAVTVK